MNDIIEINEEKLAKYLKLWFDSADLDKPHFLERNPVAKVLKKELCARNRWAAKKAPRRAAHLIKYRFK